MAGPGRPRKIVEVEMEQIEAVDISGSDVQIENENVTQVEKPTVVISTHLCWRYHSTEQPKLFQKNDVIPEGWIEEDLVGWQPDAFGKWTRKDK